MKLFCASEDIGYESDLNYNWCMPNEILMFGQFQESHQLHNISMCGIATRKFTTRIVVKEVSIPFDFLKELFCQSVERAMLCKIDKNGDYEVNISGMTFNFNINDIVNELLDKAKQFNWGDIVTCQGRSLKLKQP